MKEGQRAKNANTVAHMQKMLKKNACHWFHKGGQTRMKGTPTGIITHQRWREDQGTSKLQRGSPSASGDEVMRTSSSAISIVKLKTPQTACSLLNMKQLEQRYRNGIWCK